MSAVTWADVGILSALRVVAGHNVAQLALGSVGCLVLDITYSTQQYNRCRSTVPLN
jgi:hypothetical protein